MPGKNALLAVPRRLKMINNETDFKTWAQSLRLRIKLDEDNTYVITPRAKHWHGFKMAYSRPGRIVLIQTSWTKKKSSVWLKRLARDLPDTKKLVVGDGEFVLEFPEQFAEGLAKQFSMVKRRPPKMCDSCQMVPVKAKESLCQICKKDTAS
jgi:hypothetical protein